MDEVSQIYGELRKIWSKLRFGEVYTPLAERQRLMEEERRLYAELEKKKPNSQ